MISYSNLAKFIVTTLLLAVVIIWTTWWFKLDHWSWYAVVGFIGVVNGTLGARKWPLYVGVRNANR